MCVLCRVCGRCAALSLLLIVLLTCAVMNFDRKITLRVEGKATSYLRKQRKYCRLFWVFFFLPKLIEAKESEIIFFLLIVYCLFAAHEVSTTSVGSFVLNWSCAELSLH